MSGEMLPFGGCEYFCLLGLLLVGRGADFLSTWVATPNLVLEGNPLARRMGWKFGGLVNLALAFWLTTTLVVVTASLLVAARNFHSAWVMRAMGEEDYRAWFTQRVSETTLPLCALCLLGETGPTALVGAGVIRWSREDSPAFAIGCGVVSYALIVLFYTSLSWWRMRRHIGSCRSPAPTINL
jgi:hypothetical protein